MITFVKEQVILVTGASSGIGKAIALQCNKLGATVIANGRNIKRLQEVKSQSSFPEAFHLEPLDLTADMDNLPLWVKSLREKYGKLSGLVPCAGVSLVTPLRDYTREAANQIFDIHYHVPLLLAKGFADRRNNVGNGSAIVFMSSGGVIARAPGLSIYGGAKGALIAAAGSLSKELAPLKIRVNVLAPALVQTPMGDAFFSMISEEAKEKEVQLYPFGIGEPSDVAGTAAFLLSSAGKWITGQTIVLDGGRY